MLRLAPAWRHTCSPPGRCQQGTRSIAQKKRRGKHWDAVRKAWWVSHEPSGLLAASDPHGSSHVYAGGFATILETTGGSQTWDNRPINGGTQAMEPGALAVD